MSQTLVRKTGIDGIHLAADCIEGALVYGNRQPF